MFVGRDEALALLGGALARGGSVVVTQAVYGLGGVGKSELALQHAHAHRDDYQLIWWITADGRQPDRGRAGRRWPGGCARRSRWPGTTAEAAAWAVGWLQAHDRWLLILDNVDDPDDVEPLLGQLHGGHIVLTTRRDVDWQRIAVPIRLDVLDPDPAAQIITARTGHTSARDRQTAAAIAAELGFLPLALDQAAAYIIQARIPPGRYLDTAAPAPGPDVRRHRGAGRRSGPSPGCGTSPSRPSAAATPVRSGCCSPGLLRARQHSPRHHRRPRPTPGEDDEQLGLLASYSMITLTADTVSMHRLVQAVILASADHDRRRSRPRRHRAGMARRRDPRRPRQQRDRLAAAARPGPARRRSSPAATPPAGTSPCGSAGCTTSSRSSTSPKVTTSGHSVCVESALRIHQATLGPTTRTWPPRWGTWPAPTSALGRAADALPLQRAGAADHRGGAGSRPSGRGRRAGEPGAAPTRTWAGPRTRCPCSSGRCRSPRRRWVLTTRTWRSGWGTWRCTYRDLGRAADALPLEQRALQITETALGPDHPDVAIRLGNLARHLQRAGAAAEALPLEQRALQITEAALGPDHPRLAVALGNLAATYRALGRAADALPLERAGAAHHRGGAGPRTTPTWPSRWGTWPSTYRDWGGPATRCRWQQRALQITEAALGPDHPQRGRRAGEPGRTPTRALGRAAEALPLQQRALQIAEAKFNVQATQLAFDRLRNQDPAAAELAAICAFLAPEPIPADWFPRAAKALPPPLDSKAADPLAWRQVLGRVAQQALARLDQHGLVMHRLTQAIVRDYLPPEVARYPRGRSGAAGCEPSGR